MKNFLVLANEIYDCLFIVINILICIFSVMTLVFDI